MILKILGCGTSTGVPVPACRCEICTTRHEKNCRTRSSALISTDAGLNILIDASTDFRQQVLANNVFSIDAVLLTHPHADHILGIDDLRGFNYAQGEAIPLFATTSAFGEIKRVFSYIFNRDPGYMGGSPPELDYHEIFDDLPFQINDVIVRPFPLIHGKTQTVGFRIGELGYCTDCKAIPEASMNILSGVKILIIDALRHAPHATHMTFSEAIEVSRKLGAKRTILTHMAHSIDYQRESAGLPEGVELAYDGMEITFSGE